MNPKFLNENFRQKLFERNPLSMNPKFLNENFRQKLFEQKFEMKIPK
jgi:hypothetical protein